MTIKREAAFHEARHAIAAWKSKYHSLVGTISLADYGAGDTLVSVSKHKLQVGGKSLSTTIVEDPDVAKDFAVVLSAGLVAEQVAASKGENITANPQCAVPDHDLMKQQLAAAGLSKKFDKHEIVARQLLLS